MPQVRVLSYAQDGYGFGYGFGFVFLPPANGYGFGGLILGGYATLSTLQSPKVSAPPILMLMVFIYPKLKQTNNQSVSQYIELSTHKIIKK